MAGRAGWQERRPRPGRRLQDVCAGREDAQNQVRASLFCFFLSADLWPRFCSLLHPRHLGRSKYRGFSVDTVWDSGRGHPEVRATAPVDQAVCCCRARAGIQVHVGTNVPKGAEPCATPGSGLLPRGPGHGCNVAGDDRFPLALDCSVLGRLDDAPP